MLMLAKWIMGGPLQALAAAALLALIPGLGWASGAVIALVVLRKNIADAALPLAGALGIGFLVHWTAGDVAQAGLVLGAFAGSIVLVSVRHLGWALITVSLVSALYVALVLTWAPEKIDQLVALYQPLFDAWFEELRKTNADAEAMLDQFDVRSFVIESMALLINGSSIIALLFARWMQARLYNPGGFRVEFHALRLVPVSAVMLMAGLGLAQHYPEARVILPCLALPLLVAGLGLFHGVVGRKPNNGTMMVFFYLALVLSSGLGAIVLIAAAVLDSFVDFRKRIQTRYE